MCCTNWIIDDLNNELWNVKGSEIDEDILHYYPLAKT
jgi:hypothetical protein